MDPTTRALDLGGANHRVIADRNHIVMINPSAVTNFHRSEYELQEFLLFATLVAGKAADQQAQKLERLMQVLKSPPFRKIAQMSDGELLAELKTAKIGQYSRVSRCWRALAKMSQPLSVCSLEALEAIHGIGPKTARYFILHSRESQRVAVLDAHILRWIGVEMDIAVPKKTPHSAKKYRSIERRFLQYCDDHNVMPSDLDLRIWNSRNG